MQDTRKSHHHFAHLQNISEKEQLEQFDFVCKGHFIFLFSRKPAKLNVTGQKEND